MAENRTRRTAARKVAALIRELAAELDIDSARIFYRLAHPWDAITGDDEHDERTFTLTTGQVDYLRELVFEDLKEWADAVREMAWAASETQGRSTEAADAEAMCTNARTGARPVMAVLDLLGWEHPEHVAWRLQKQREGAES